MTRTCMHAAYLLFWKKSLLHRELRKYTLGDRAGTEEFNDDRIASECSQGVHLNIP